jgi:hypothetical protein
MGAGAIELVVERAAAALHRLEDLGCNASRGEALHFRILVPPVFVLSASVGPFGGWSVRLARGLHRAFLVRALYIPRGPTCHTKSLSRKVEPMPNDLQTPQRSAADAPEGVAERPPQSPEAQRALAEAAARRAARDGAERSEDAPKEINGRDGPEPTRYGDWEVNGITSDF